jgi:hypothetical protein
MQSWIGTGLRITQEETLVSASSHALVLSESGDQKTSWRSPS